MRNRIKRGIGILLSMVLIFNVEDMFRQRSR